MKKTEEIVKYELAAKQVDTLIIKGVIQNFEIEELFHIDVNEMVTIIVGKDDSYKKKVMQTIYFNPYILYFSKNISNRVQEELVKFVKYRYLQELYELDSKLDICEIDKNTYSNELSKIQMAYFYSSSYGINIGRIIEKEQKVKTKKH